MKILVVSYQMKFLLHCGELLRRLKIQVRVALSCLSLLPMQLQETPQCHAAVPYSSCACLADPKAALLTLLHLGAFQPTQWKLVSEGIDEAYGSSVHIMELCAGCFDKERQKMRREKNQNKT